MWRFAIAAAVTLMLAADANALPTAWRLRDVSFDDGGSASGTFVYDPSTDTVSTWSISVLGGRQPPFSNFTFAPDNSTATAVDDVRFRFSTADGHVLFFRTATPLPSRTTALIALVIEFGISGECVYPCDPPGGTVRSFAGGDVIHVERAGWPDIPTAHDSALLVCVLGLALLGWSVLRR